MRVLQVPIPMSKISSSMGPGIGLTLSHFIPMATVMRPLIDDGAGEHLFRGTATASPPAVTNITDEAGLLLIAKDASTLVRGLAAYPTTQLLRSSDSGLGMIALRRNNKTNSVVAGFLKWGFNNVKQNFIHDTFKLAAWFAKHGLEFNQRKGADRRLSELFRNVGGDYIFTFGDFRKAMGRDARIQHKCAMVLLCRTGDLDVGLDVPDGGVLRQINQTMSLHDLGPIAGRLLARD